MAQDGTTAGGASYTIDNVTFPVGRTKLQSIFNAIRTNNKGASAPDLVAGQFWIDDSTDPTWTLYLFDGTDSIQFCTINTTDNSVNFIDSTFTQLTSNLDLNSYTINGTGNINITGNITASGNLAGTLTTASQPNITSVGTLTGLTTTGDINFGDDDKAVFGTGTDLLIYHNGTHSFIEEQGTGDLRIKGETNILLGSTTGGQTYANFAKAGSVDLYHNGTKKFETTSTGIDVTGTVVSDGLTVESGIGNTALLGVSTDSGTEVLLADQVGGVSFKNVNGDIELRVNGSASTASSSRLAQKINDNGDISFYEDTGTTPKFFWDASEESLGIGTTSPSFTSGNPEITISGNIGFLNFQGNRTAGAGNNVGIIRNYNGSTEISRIATFLDSGTTDGAIGFSTASSGSLSERMRIDSSGNVGIGATPSSTIRNDITSAEKALQIGNRAMFFSDGGVTTDLQNNSHLNNSNNRVAMQTDAGSLYQQYQGVHKWFNAASVSAGATQTMTERMRIDSSGNLDMTNGGGNIKLANGAGIDFSATAGTGSSELLDDYETGTFTVGTYGDATGAFITETGEYTKIGNVVHVRIVFGVSTNFTGTAIDGLPFTANHDTSASSILGTNAFLTLSNTNGVIFGKVPNGGSRIEMCENNNFNDAHSPNTSNSYYRISLWYYTS